MSNLHIDAAWQVKVPGRLKLILLALADHACAECGLAWPGVPRLAERTGVCATKVREALQALTDAGLLEIRRYPRGGRGRATEYVVLASLVSVGQRPCGICARNLAGPVETETHRTGDGFRTASRKETHQTGDGNGEGKPTARVMGMPEVIHKPTRFDPKTHHTGDDQPSVEQEPSTRARARARPALDAEGQKRNHQASQPASVADALRTLMPGLGVAPMLESIPAEPALAASPAEIALAPSRGGPGCRSPADAAAGGEAQQRAALAAHGW